MTSTSRQKPLSLFEAIRWFAEENGIKVQSHYITGELCMEGQGV